ncbi:MAG: protein-disulfide reductase DsbD family protein, partial [Spirochaetota bacterium]|nr:protein-disulfide reductase DsbD family protein [Spirochaetota bacterium]
MKRLFFLLISGLFLLNNISILIADENVSVSAEISPSELIAGEEGLLTVTFNISEGFHQTRSDDFFFISFENNAWFPMSEIIYPEGIIKDGLENFYGSVTLKANFIVSENIPSGQQTAQIQAAWQICDEEGVCFFPEEVLIEVPVQITGETSIGNQSFITL